MKVHYFQELKFSEEIPRYRDKNYYFKNKYHFWRKCFLSPGTENFWFISDFWAISDCPERYEAIFATKIWKFSATCIKKGRLDQSWLFLHIQIFSDQFDKLFTAKKRAKMIKICEIKFYLEKVEMIDANSFSIFELKIQGQKY